MVVKIQPPAPNITNAVVYNERKMTGPEEILSEEQEPQYIEEENTGHVLATRNVPDTSTLENEFARLKWLNNFNTKGRKLKNPTFHMSINPGVNDKPMSESEIVAFADELMTRLGYKDSPYRIFRHDDTGRTHYHLVGTRIGQDGKKIDDSFEEARCEKICRSLEDKYGFTYGLQEEKKETKEKTENKGRKESVSEASTIPAEQPVNNNTKGRKTPEKEPKKYIAPFDVNSEIPVTEQYRIFHAEAMKWYFTTPEQYSAILKYRFNTNVDMTGDVDREGLNEMLEYTGLSKYGNKITAPVNEKELGISALDDVLNKCASTEMKNKRSQRERLEKNALWAAENSTSWEDFRKNMESKGIITVISWSEKNEPFGITWLDRATKCAWKGSETSVNLEWLKKTAEEKNWKISRHPRYEKSPRRTNEKKASALRSGKRNTSLRNYNDKNTIRDLLNKRNANKTKRSNADASKNSDGIRYGDEKENNDIII